jgi:hypothetical protein
MVVVAVEKIIVGQKTSGSSSSSNLHQCWTIRDSEGGEGEGEGVRRLVYRPTAAV